MNANANALRNPLAERELDARDLIVLSDRSWAEEGVPPAREHRWFKHFQKGEHRVFFVESARLGGHSPRLEIRQDPSGVRVVTPCVPRSLYEEDTHRTLRKLLEEMVAALGMADYALWYQTPLAIPFTRQLRAKRIVYDCVRDAVEATPIEPLQLAYLAYEAELYGKADLILASDLESD